MKDKVEEKKTRASDQRREFLVHKRKKQIRSSKTYLTSLHNCQSKHTKEEEKIGY